MKPIQNNESGASARKKINDCFLTVDSLATNVSGIQGELREFHFRLREIEQQIAQLWTAVQARDKKIESLNSTVETQLRHLGTLDRMVDDNRSGQKKLWEKVIGLEKTISKYHNLKQ